MIAGFPLPVLFQISEFCTFFVPFPKKLAATRLSYLVAA